MRIDTLLAASLLVVSCLAEDHLFERCEVYAGTRIDLRDLEIFVPSGGQRPVLQKWNAENIGKPAPRLDRLPPIDWVAWSNLVEGLSAEDSFLSRVLARIDREGASGDRAMIDAIIVDERRADRTNTTRAARRGAP